MGLPAKKRTPRSRDERRSHHALKPKTTRTCEKCNKPVLPHKVCENCGIYRGRQVINVEKRLTRRTKRTKRIS